MSIASKNFAEEPFSLDNIVVELPAADAIVQDVERDRPIATTLAKAREPSAEFSAERAAVAAKIAKKRARVAPKVTALPTISLFSPPPPSVATAATNAATNAATTAATTAATNAAAPAATNATPAATNAATAAASAAPKVQIKKATPQPLRTKLSANPFPNSPNVMRLLMVSARPETAQRNLHVKQTVSQTKLAAPASVKIVSMTPVSIATSARQKITAQKTLTPVTVAVMPAPLKITAQQTLPAKTIVSTPTVAIGKSAMPITSTATDVAARGGVTPIASGQASVAQLVRLPTLVNRPRVGFITDNRMLEHICACQHYENPQRLQSITTALRYMSRPFFVLQSREATDQELATCHNVKAILKQISEIEIRPSDEYDDMYAVPGKTLLAARLAAGCSIQLVQDIVADKIDCGFAAVRPPGHHAHYDHVAGFCFFNNAVLAAVAAASANKRVLIVDFDVHFGDGTTNILGRLDNKNLACVSIHRYDLYPNSEDDMKRKTVSSERLLNIYFTGTRGDKYYIKEFKEKLLPFAQKFVPDLIVVSGGFDAALGDPLGECRVTPDGYRTLIQLLKTVSPKIAILLEGGYNLTAIAKSAVACVEALFEESNLLPSAQTRLPPSEANFAPLKPLALPVASMLTAPALPKITNETVRKTEQS